MVSVALRLYYVQIFIFNKSMKYHITKYCVLYNIILVGVYLLFLPILTSSIELSKTHFIMIIFHVWLRTRISLITNFENVFEIILKHKFEAARNIHTVFLLLS